MELTIEDKRQRTDSEEDNDYPAVNKRRLPDSEEDDHPTIHERRLPDSEDDNTTKHALYLMRDLWTRLEVKLDEVNTRSSNIERSVMQVKDRLDNIERSITEMKDKVEGLDTDHACRCDSEVRQDIIEEVQENCEDYVSEVKWTYTYVTQDLDKYCDKAKTDMRETCKETMDEWEEQCEVIRDKFGLMKDHLSEVAKVFDKFGYA